MIEGLPWPVWTGFLAASVAMNIATFRALLRGLLVPRKTHQDALDAAATKDKQIAEKDLQLRYMDEVGRSVNAVMRAVQQGATSDHEVGE